MPANNTVRIMPDPVALASQGRVTSQIRSIDSSDKPLISTITEDKPVIISAEVTIT